MLNEEKIRAMTRLAMYEQGEGKKYLPVSRYYRSDYIGQALLRTFLSVTAGYALILLVLALYYSEFLMNNIHRMDFLRLLAVYLIIGYAALFVVYIIVTYVIYTVKYFKAKKSVREYYRKLTALDKMYTQERKAQLRDRTGGRRR
ncbi:MAG: hypothetical protein IKE03_01210 [Blautia sp.]|nr:hypothetical protein [Blautia sp.]